MLKRALVTIRSDPQFNVVLYLSSNYLSHYLVKLLLSQVTLFKLHTFSVRLFIDLGLTLWIN